MGSRFCLFFRCYSLPLPVKFIKRSTIEYFLLVITNVLFLTEPVKALIYTDIPFCLFIFLLNTPCCIYTDTFLNIRYIPFRIIIISSRFLFNISLYAFILQSALFLLFQIFYAIVVFWLETLEKVTWLLQISSCRQSIIMRFSSKSRAACFYCIFPDLLICIIFYVDQITCRCWCRQSADA